MFLDNQSLDALYSQPILDTFYTIYDKIVKIGEAHWVQETRNVLINKQQFTDLITIKAPLSKDFSAKDCKSDSN